MIESKTTVKCDGWLEKCDQFADPPYRFCKRHLEEYKADPWAPLLDAYR